MPDQSQPGRPPAASPSQEADKPCLHVCVTCTGPAALSADLPEQGPRPGQRLYETLRESLEKLGPSAPLRVEPVLCLANCERGCSATISMDGKWAYLLGFLGEAQADELVEYARTFAASENGAVLRSKRPASLHHAVMGRFPGTLAPRKEAAE